MFKEKITNHLKNVGEGTILGNVRKLENNNVGVDSLNISNQEALAAGVKRYRLPEGVAKWLAEPAIEATVSLKSHKDEAPHIDQ